MPQLDLLIFKYENFNFIVSFFIFFFINQYLVFPSIIRNIVLRRRLITRNLSSDTEIFFSVVFFRKFSMNKLDGYFFTVSVSYLRSMLTSFYSLVSSLSNFFMRLKKSLYITTIKDFVSKAKLFCWLGLLYSNEITYI